MIPSIDFKVLTEKNDCGTFIFRCSQCKMEVSSQSSLCRKCFQELVESSAKTWTSNDTAIDEFILKSQREADYIFKAIEWIPYDEFTDVEHIAEGGFSTVHKSTWKQGNWELIHETYANSTRMYKRKGP